MTAGGGHRVFYFFSVLWALPAHSDKVFSAALRLCVKILNVYSCNVTQNAGAEENPRLRRAFDLRRTFANDTF